MRIFLIIFAILVSGTIVTVSIGYSESVDMRGWWPIVAAVDIIKSCIFVTMLFLLHRKVHTFSQRFLLYLTGALVSVHMLQAVMFYKISADRFGIREVALALPLLEQVLLSDRAFYGIDLFFIVVAVVWAYRQRWLGSGKTCKNFL
jgi:hypothetical protein